MNLFDLTARIFLDTKDYEKGVNDAQKDTNDFASRLRSGLGTAAKVAGVAVTATAAATTFLIKKVVQGTKETAEYGDNIDKMSQKLGLTAKAYQEWDYVLGQNGVQIDSAAAGLKTLTNQVDAARGGSEEAIARFEKLGISLDDLNTMSREDIFSAAIAGFQGMADSTERAALANDIFGRSGQELAPLFNQTAEATDELKQKARDLGMVMSDEAVKASAAYSDSLDTLKRTTTGLKNNLMSEFLPSLTTVMDGLSEIFAGKDSGIGKVGKGIEDFIKNLNKQLPKVIKVGSKIIVQLVKAISDNLPELANAALEAINSFVVDGILPNLPKIIDSGLKMLLALAKGLADNVGKITQTLVSVVVEIAKTLTNPKSISELIKAAVKMAVELGKGLISAIPQILTAIPEIIAGIAEGLLTGITEIGRELGKAFFGIGKKAEEYAQGISDNAAVTDKFRQAMDNLKPTLMDVDKLLSSSGKTISELDTEIGDTESKITDILKKAFDDQNGLREEDIKNIEKYMADIRRLEEEKLEIYRSQQISELKKIGLEIGQLDKEQAEQRLVNAKEALAKVNEATEQAYTNRLTMIENKYKNEGDVISAAHQSELNEAKRWYDAQIAESQSYYTETTQLIADESDKWEGLQSETWAKIGELISQFKINSGNEIKDFVTTTQDKFGYLDGVKESYMQMLKDMDTTTENSFFNMKAQVVQQGGDIGEESKNTAKNILSAFDDLPDGMDEAGKNALLGMISGLEEYIPKLANSSEMSAKEIVSAIEEYLGISSPSKVLTETGRNAILGLIKGEQSEQKNLNTASKKIVDGMKNVFTSSTGQFNSIGGSLASGLASGFAAMRNSLISKVKNVLSGVVSAAKNILGIHSPSRVFAQIGENMSKGVGVGWDDAFGDVHKDIIGSMSGLVDDADMPLDLTDYDTSIVSRETGAAGGFGAQIIAALDEYFPELIDTIARLKVYLDTGALVGEMTPLLDRSLGQESIYRRRAN